MVSRSPFRKAGSRSQFFTNLLHLVFTSSSKLSYLKIQVEDIFTFEIAEWVTANHACQTLLGYTLRFLTRWISLSPQYYNIAQHWFNCLYVKFFISRIMFFYLPRGTNLFIFNLFHFTFNFVIWIFFFTST